ncbi:MAG: alpha/beta fold hydrolase [archaeon]|nr:alpha/beta fold hydrolase [archaeon]
MKNGKNCTVLKGTIEEPVFFHLHGFASRREKARTIAEFINKNGYTTVFCDARGHGKDKEGKFYEIEETIEDYNRRINSIKATSVIVVGHSMGATESIHLAKNPKVKKIFAICPICNLSVDNLHFLHKLILASRLPLVLEDHIDLKKQMKEQNKNLSEKSIEIEKQFQVLDEQMRKIDEKKNPERFKQLKMKIQENKWIKQLLQEIQESEFITNLLKELDELKISELGRQYFNEIKDKYYDFKDQYSDIKIQYHGIKEQYHEIKDQLNVKDYYINIKEVWEELINRSKEMYYLLPKNLELTEEETSKLYIISSKTDLIVPFENHTKLVEKFNIPKERTLEIISPHQLSHQLASVRTWILSNVSNEK